MKLDFAVDVLDANHGDHGNHDAILSNMVLEPWSTMVDHGSTMVPEPSTKLWSTMVTKVTIRSQIHEELKEKKHFE